MPYSLFTSESVAIGHPDKLADQISDAILDACLEIDPSARVASETMITANLVILAGEITKKGAVDYKSIARNTIKEAGYTHPSLGFDYKSCVIIENIINQSIDIALGVDETETHEMGAGDQGIIFGFACNETPELMPMPITLANMIVKELYRLRVAGEIPYLGPDAKSQVTVEYSEGMKPFRIDSIVISTQHSPDITQAVIIEDMKQMVYSIFPNELLDNKTRFFINPTGRFVIGGPASDCGLTGRKIIVDTYGGMARHGGGAFSGKDPTKVDRSAAYAARYIAKNIVAAGLAERCEVQICYAIGVAEPLAISVNTFQTGIVPDDKITEAVKKTFRLTPGSIISMLQLRRPIYKKIAFGGHFGRTEPEYLWEKTDRMKELKEALC